MRKKTVAGTKKGQRILREMRKTVKQTPEPAWCKWSNHSKR